jgi:hypothetical protein
MRGRIKLAAVAATLVIFVSTFLHAQNSVAPKKPAARKSASALSSQPPSAEAWYAVPAVRNLKKTSNFFWGKDATLWP